MDDTTDDVKQQLDKDRPNRKRRKNGDKYPSRILDPITQQREPIPKEVLTPAATSREIVSQVNALTKTVMIQSAVISEFRDWFAHKRAEKDVDETAVALLASRGNSINTICTLLGIDAGAFSKRRELRAAYDIGKAELHDALANKTLDTAFNGKGMVGMTMQIFLAKALMGWRDGNSGPGGQVNVNVNVGSGSLKDKIRKAREDALAAREVWDDTVNAIDAEIDDTVVSEVGGSDSSGQ
jgi:hypothetical protein